MSCHFASDAATAGLRFIDVESDAGALLSLEGDLLLQVVDLLLLLLHSGSA